MKKTLTCLFIVCSLFTSQAQDDVFQRKGSILLETGYNLIAGVFSGSGASIFLQDGETVTSIGADMGYFLSEDFALKFKLSIISGNGTLTNIGAGGKYYIGGVAPIEGSLGLLTGQGLDAFVGNVGIGYAAVLAPNIYLEPSIGLFVIDGDSAVNIRIMFAMIL